MAVLVDHSKRRARILECAFELFAQQGFAGVSYRMIAERCGVPRASIYKYFKDKDQIFLYAIKSSTDKLSSTIKRLIERPELSPVDKLRRSLHLTTKMLTENRIFLSVILNYLLSLRSSGVDVRQKAKMRTFGFRFLLTRLVNDAISQGLFRQISADQIAARLYSIVEAYVLNLTVLDSMDRKECAILIDSYIEECMVNSPQAYVE